MDKSECAFTSTDCRCVCVCERERARESEREIERENGLTDTILVTAELMPDDSARFRACIRRKSRGEKPGAHKT